MKIGDKREAEGLWNFIVDRGKGIKKEDQVGQREKEWIENLRGIG